MGISCAGQATTSIKGNTTAKTANLAGEKNTAATYVQNQGKVDPSNPLGFAIKPPDAPIDWTSEAVKQRRASQQLMLLSGRGRREAFLGGYGPGALSAAPR